MLSIPLLVWAVAPVLLSALAVVAWLSWDESVLAIPVVIAPVSSELTVDDISECTVVPGPGVVSEASGLVPADSGF